jgi:hypothetical protein
LIFLYIHQPTPTIIARIIIPIKIGASLFLK